MMGRGGFELPLYVGVERRIGREMFFAVVLRVFAERAAVRANVILMGGGSGELLHANVRTSLAI
jgi:hypothetical protein